MPLADNTQVLNECALITEASTKLIENLKRDNPSPTPDKAKTLQAIYFVLEIQSKFIRNLVEERCQILDMIDDIDKKNFPD